MNDKEINRLSTLGHAPCTTSPSAFPASTVSTSALAVSSCRWQSVQPASQQASQLVLEGSACVVTILLLLLPSQRENPRTAGRIVNSGSQPLHITGLPAVIHCCPRCHDKKKPWDMARPEQVLLLEPQHELKFRGNVKAEAGGGIGPDTRWRTCALSYVFAPLTSGRPL